MAINYKRRLLGASALLLSSAVALAACGSGAPGTENAGGGESDGVTEVTFWQRKFQESEDAWYKKQVEAYNASQDKIHVNYQLIPGDAWDQKMKAAQAAGNAPDIYTLDYNKLATAYSNGVIQSMTDYIPTDGWADLMPNVAEMVTVSGEKVAYPILVEPSAVLWYRADLFEAAGLDPNKPPTTWNELVEYGKKLTQGDSVYGMSMAQVKVEQGWSTWGLQYNAAGHLPISDDWSTAKANDPAYKPLLKLFQDLYTQGIMPKQALAPYPDIMPFGQGKLAMAACGSWAGGELINTYPEMVANTRVAPFPSMDGDATKPTATLGGWTLVMDGKSTKQTAAGEFVAWLAAGDPQIMADYYKTTQYSKFAVRTSVNDMINADATAAAANPWRQIIADQVIPFSKAEATYDWTISEAFSEAIETSMQGGDIDAALATAQEKITTAIEKLGIAGKGPGPSN